MLDIRPISPLADYFVIGSGNSERQVKALVEEISLKMKEEQTVPLRIEGVPSSGWMLMDYGAVIVHIFAPAEREYYQLEKLWGKATTVVRIQ